MGKIKIDGKTFLITQDQHCYELLHHTNSTTLTKILLRQPVLKQTLTISCDKTKSPEAPIAIDVGKGHFSNVRLAQSNNIFYAVRTIKSQCDLDKQGDNAKREKVVSDTRQELRLHKKLREIIGNTKHLALIEDVVIANKGPKQQIFQFFKLMDLGNCEKFSQILSKMTFSIQERILLTRHIAHIIINTLAELHKKRFYVRDLKPENILVMSNGDVTLSDFGSSRYFESDNQYITASSLSEGVYIPPYRLLTDSNIENRDKLHDLWALGLTLLQLPNKTSLNTVCKKIFSQAKRFKELLKNSTDDDTHLNQQLTQEYINIIAELRRNAEFNTLPIYLQKIILELLEPEKEKRKISLEDIIQPFLSELKMSDEEDTKITECFKTIATKSTVTPTLSSFKLNEKSNYYEENRATPTLEKKTSVALKPPTSFFSLAESQETSSSAISEKLYSCGLNYKERSCRLFYY